jgi:hypothetical protein
MTRSDPLRSPRWCSFGVALLGGVGVVAPASARAEAPPAAWAPPPAGEAGADEAAAREQEARLDAWSGLSFGWDLHAEAIALFKRYTIGERQAWYSGQGLGGGATASLHFRPAGALRRGVLRWVEFELGVGNSTHFVRWEEGEEARPQTEFVENQTYAILGVHLGSGRWPAGDSAWSGAVVGLAWVPTYMYFIGNDDFDSGGLFNQGGVRLSVDWGRVSPTSKGLVPGLRAFLTWLPYIGSLPTSVTAGVGCVFY